MEAVVSTFLLPFLGPWPWLTTAMSWLLGAGLVVGLGFLIAPVTSIFAGVFLDDVAEAVEQRHYPNDAPGRPLPIVKSAGIATRFFGLVVLGNLLALLLVLFLGLGIVIFFVVNGYLLGREYFQFASLRHVSSEESERLRQNNSGAVFFAGLVMAGLLAIPFLNLLTPLFSGALMVHLFKYVQRKDAASGRASAGGTQAAV